MTLLGFTLGKIYPPITKQIDKVIIVIIFVSLMPGAISYLLNRRKKPPPAADARLCDDGEEAKAPVAGRSRAPAPKVAFPKKGQPPTHAEFAARLPARSASASRCCARS